MLQVLQEMLHVILYA